MKEMPCRLHANGILGPPCFGQPGLFVSYAVRYSVLRLLLLL